MVLTNNRESFFVFTALLLGAIVAPGCGGGGSDGNSSEVVTGVTPNTFAYFRGANIPYGGESTTTIEVEINGRNVQTGNGTQRYTARVDGANFPAEGVSTVDSTKLRGMLHVPMSLLSGEGASNTHKISVFDTVDKNEVANETEQSTVITFSELIAD